MSVQPRKRYCYRNLGKGELLHLLVVLLCLSGTLYLLDNRQLLLGAVALCVSLGLAVWWFFRLKQKETALLRLVEGESVFHHPNSPPINPAELADLLRREGFAVQEYPDGNYHGVQQLRKQYTYHVFLSNQKTPHREEYKPYFQCYIQTFREAQNAMGNQFLLDYTYGKNLERTALELVKAARTGFITSRKGGPFGYRAAYDVKTHTLYLAEAVTQIDWPKNAYGNRFTVHLLQTLFPAACGETPTPVRRKAGSKRRGTTPRSTAGPKRN